MPDLTRPPSDDVTLQQLKAAYQPTNITHKTSLMINQGFHANTLIGIVSKIGPATNNPEMIVELMKNGMNIAKVSFSLGDHAEHAGIIKHIREAVNAYGQMNDMVYPLAILAETKGPEVHLGRLAGDVGEVCLVTGETVVLTSDKKYENEGTKDILYVDYPNMTHDMEPSFTIYISYGFVKLDVTEVGHHDITCLIDCGGKVNSYDLVNLPSNSIALPTLSDKDKEDIKFAVEQQVDILSVAFVRSGETVKEVRELMGEKGKNIFVMANIEDQEGFDNVDEILAEADGLLVARGNLGINLAQQKLFLAQKIIIGLCNKAGKPCVIGTQMLKSMVDNPFPSSAEVTDIANAVVEGGDCMVLNDETHHGSYPLECIKVMTNVLREAEGSIWQNRVFNDLYMHALPPVTDSSVAIAIAAVKASMKINASAIVVVTATGRSAVVLARWRPRCPIIAVTRVGYVARRLQVYKGVFSMHYTSPPLSCWQADVDARIQLGITYGKKLKFIKPGNPIILVSGWRHGAGFTNTIRLIFAADPSKRAEKVEEPPVAEESGDVEVPGEVEVPGDGEE